jgi:DMSO/TMAO reductase YedYZ molybdopterin-dependent catalytic subunit
MRISRAAAACLLVVLSLTAVAVAAAAPRPQAAAAPAVAAGAKSVAIAGDLAKPFVLTLADLKTMTRKSVIIDEDGKKTTFEGVLLGDVLARAGAPLGRELSGKAVASYLLASASDGYQAVFALAEADPAFSDSDLIIADTVDGKPLFDYQGPMRLVAPHDKRGARGVRMLERIELVRLRK